MPDDSKPSEGLDQSKGGKGPLTLFTEASKMAEEKAAKEREREIARDKEQEKEKDKWAERALTTAEERAKVAEAQVSSLHKRYGIVIMLLVLAVVGLAGYRVAGNLLKGEVNIGGTHIEKKAP